MPEGFYSRTELEVFTTPSATSSVPKCGACGLYKGCKSPKMPVAGKGKRKVLVIGEAPGEKEDYRNKPFVGKAGQRLQTNLAKLGFDLFEDAWVTNTLICFTGETLVESPSPIFRIYRRSYSGLLIRVKTSSGRVFTGTPNHPVLTSSGWKSLGLIEKGDDLINCSVVKRPKLTRSNVNNPPPTIEEVFNSLFDMRKVHRVIGRRMDFHGDGENSNVDIVSTDGLLWDRIQSSVNEHRRQFPLKSPNESSPDFLSSGSLIDARKNLGSGLFLSSERFVCSSSKRLSPRPAHTAKSLSHTLTSGSDCYSCTSEEKSNSIPSHTKTPTDTLRALPRPITTDHVVKIERKRCGEFFDGDNAPYRSTHVYNLETGDNYYIIAGGIVVSNCRPPGNATPTEKQIGYCRPNVFNAIAELDPNVIVLLGNPALVSVIGRLWKANPGPISRWAGFRCPSQEVNAWICPTFHPSYVMREDSPVLDLIFRNHLKAAFSLASKPWKIVPDYASRVECYSDGAQALQPLRQMLSDGGKRLAFDYECTALKPESTRALIVSCAVSDGRKSIAFAWEGPVVNVVRDWLKSDSPKVAANMKFEDRWTLHEFGFQVNGWDFDTMLAAHVLDNRPLVSGLKFQAFARLGQKEYDRHVAPFLKSRNKGGYEENRIRKCLMKDLLLYNGMDALLEALLARVQEKEL